jgi:hypothetical protein
MFHLIWYILIGLISGFIAKSESAGAILGHTTPRERRCAAE